MQEKNAFFPTAKADLFNFLNAFDEQWKKTQYQFKPAIIYNT